MSTKVFPFGNVPAAAGRPRLYCVPSSGAGAAMYRSWPGQLAAAYDVRAYQPPGRGGRIRETPFSTVAEAAAGLVAAIAGDTDGDFAVFGHSLGALVAFEAARLARRQGLRGPSLLIVSACAAPHRIRGTALRTALRDDETLVAFLRKLGGTPAEVLAHPDLLAYFLPAVRTDLAMMAAYRYTDEPPVDVPLVVLGGNQDPQVHADELAFWRNHTTGATAVELLAGGHFYLSENPAFCETLTTGAAGVQQSTM